MSLSGTYQSIIQALDRKRLVSEIRVSPQIEAFGVKQVEGGIEISLSLTNLTDAAIELQDVDYLDGVELELPIGMDRVFAQAHTMTGAVSVRDLQGEISSHACLGLTDPSGTEARLIGFTLPDKAFYTVKVVADDSGSTVRMHALVRLEGIRLSAGETFKLSPLVIWSGPSLSDLLERYAQISGGHLGVRQRAGRKKRGWCSWYHYYGTETEGDILQNAKELALSVPSHQGLVIQIDDGWNLQTKEQTRIWGDWLPGYKFSKGMRWMTDRIHELKFDAGLWLAPFSVDPSSNLASQHKDWLLKKRDGSGLCELGDCYGLDLTHPEVPAFLEETFQRVFNEWNFDYVKLDFLNHGLMDGERHDRSKTSVEAFRDAMRLIRKCAGNDRYILNCGAPLAPSIGVCDGMRVGNDVSGRWYNAMNLDEWPQGNCSIYAAAFSTIYRQWMHERWWENDPDCIITRRTAVLPELNYWKHINPNEPLANLPFGLTDEEAGFWVRLIWMGGGTALLSEVGHELDGERMALALRAMEPSPQSVRWVDYYERPDLVVMQSREGYPAVGIFNLGDEERSVRLPRRKLRLRDGQAQEWLSHESLTISGDKDLQFTLAPRSARIWIQSEGEA